MAFYRLNMLTIALELAKFDPTYGDIAFKFSETDETVISTPLEPVWRTMTMMSLDGSAFGRSFEENFALIVNIIHWHQ